MVNMACQRALRRPLTSADIVWTEMGNVIEGWQIEVTALDEVGRIGPVRGSKQSARQAAARVLCEALERREALVVSDSSGPPKPDVNWIGELNKLCQRTMRRLLTDKDITWEESGAADIGCTIKVDALNFTAVAGPTLGPKQPVRQAAAKMLCDSVKDAGKWIPEGVKAAGSVGKSERSPATARAGRAGAGRAQRVTQAWQKYFDPEQNRDWWWNPGTGAVRYDPPEPVWQQYWDPEQEKYWWFDEATEEIRYEPPPSAGSAPAAAAPTATVSASPP
jgi:hypothetical protein